MKTGRYHEVYYGYVSCKFTLYEYVYVEWWFKFADSDPYTIVDDYTYRMIQEERSLLGGDGIGLFEKICLYENVSKS
jgi:hypothetical protein